MDTASCQYKHSDDCITKTLKRFSKMFGFVRQEQNSSFSQNAKTYSGHVNKYEAHDLVWIFSSVKLPNKSLKFTQQWVRQIWANMKSIYSWVLKDDPIKGQVHMYKNLQHQVMTKCILQRLEGEKSSFHLRKEVAVIMKNWQRSMQVLRRLQRKSVRL